MTTIIRDNFDPSRKELAIALQGDRDLGDHELRRLGDIEDFKVQRLGDSLFPEGFVIDGLAPTVLDVTNLCPWSNDPTHWTPHNNCTFTPAAGTDRLGRTAATRVTGSPGDDAYIDIACGDAVDRRVAAIDLKLDSTSTARVSLFDGIAEIASVTVTLTTDWQRVEVPCEAWSTGATTLALRVRPGPGSLAGTCLVALAQVEPVAVGDPLVASSYVETSGVAVTAPGNRVAIATGRVYAKGLPRPLAAQTLTFDPLVATGTALIYAEVAERYYEGLVYSELNNPYTGDPGNDSVREVTQLVLADTTDPAPPVDLVPTNPQYRSKTAVAIYQFDRATGLVTPVKDRSVVDLSKTIGNLDGRRVLPQSIPDDRLDSKATENQPGLLAALARRLRNQSGNFVVTPDDSAPHIAQDLATTTKVRVKIDPLDGYTDGRSHYLAVPQFIETPLQTSTNPRINESHTYYGGTDTYTLGKGPVTGIDSISAIFEVTETVTRGVVAGGQDDLANGPVFQVVSVVQGGTTYSGDPGGDYIQVGDAVDWSPSGGGSAEPDPGTSYTVTYRYTRTWPGSEYTSNSNSITFTGANRPVETLPFAVSYHYGQDRVDLIYLGPDGLAVAMGTPSDHPAPPPVAIGTMPLWEAHIGYNTLAASFVPRFTVGVSMARLADIEQKVLDLTYNVAQLSTQSGLRDRNTGLKGMVVDPFIDARQFDVNAAYFGTPGALAARIALDSQTLRQARTTSYTRTAVDTSRTTMAVLGEWAGLPYTATQRIAQNQYSKDGSLNPFANYDLIPPLITNSSMGWFTDWDSAYAGLFGVQITVHGTRFQPNEAGIRITVDGVQKATVTADATGSFDLSFTDTLAPTGLIAAVGAGGSPTVPYNSNPVWPRRDPLAQTFVAPEDCDMAYVDLYFSAKHATEPVTVALRGTQSGLPTDEVLALVTLQPSSILVNGSPTRVTWPSPVALTGDTSYAIVAASNSSQHRMQIAELSKPNLGPGGGFITSNPYGLGVLAASSDGRTWSAFQDQDLRFAVGLAKYQTTGALYLQSLSYPAGVTSFQLLRSQRVKFGATVVWQYSIDAEANWVPFNPDDEIAFPTVATTLVIRALASTTKDYAGVLINVQNLVAIAYKNATSSSYVSVLTSLFQNTTSAKAYLKSYIKPGTNAVPQATVNNGANWIAGTLAATRVIDINTGLAEYEYTFAFGGAGGSSFRARIDLTTGDPTIQPIVDESAFVIL